MKIAGRIIFPQRLFQGSHRGSVFAQRGVKFGGGLMRLRQQSEFGIASRQQWIQVKPFLVATQLMADYALRLRCIAGRKQRVRLIVNEIHQLRMRRG